MLLLPIGDRAASLSGGRDGVEYQLRLCHVVEWPDFDGFGFNVHTLRDKAGQYVGNVDTDSPAAVAGSASVIIIIIVFVVVRLIYLLSFIQHKTRIKTRRMCQTLP